MERKKKAESAAAAEAKAAEQKRRADEKAKREKQQQKEQEKKRAELQAQRQQQEEKHWNTVKTMHSLDAYRDFLRQHPNGRYATQAKAAVQELKPSFPWKKKGSIGVSMMALTLVRKKAHFRYLLHKTSRKKGIWITPGSICPLSSIFS